MPDFAPRSDLTIDVQHIGASREPVLIIDNFLTDPKALVQAAVASPDWRDLPPGGYPGRRAPLPGPYARNVLRRLDGPIKKHLLSEELSLRTFECSFSLVTHAPDTLTPLQRIPHIDVINETRIAILHYLCGPEFGGTAFFRQDSTGFEQIGPPQKSKYLSERTKDLKRLSPDNTFPNPDTPGYTHTASLDARFNRIVAYRSLTLHSGIIPDAESLSEHPARGRLTGNFFVDYDTD